MQVITAPVTDPFYNTNVTGPEITVFLAGGISNCPDWQQMVIDHLEKSGNTEDLVVYNPRRKNFPMNDKNAAKAQIHWEYERLSTSHIFSMYFCNSDSDQPICMYELGRYITLKMMRDAVGDILHWSPDTITHNIADSIIISCEEGYKRKTDVIEQVFYATYGSVKVRTSDDTEVLAKEHADAILKAYRNKYSLLAHSRANKGETILGGVSL